MERIIKTAHYIKCEECGSGNYFFNDEIQKATKCQCCHAYLNKEKILSFLIEEADPNKKCCDKPEIISTTSKEYSACLNCGMIFSKNKKGEAYEIENKQRSLR